MFGFLYFSLDLYKNLEPEGFEDMLMNASEKVSQGLITPEEIHLKI